MSNVTLSIAGRSYTVACAQGEEKHVEMLGRMIDAKASGIAEGAGRNETRTLLFAALLLADELAEMRVGAPGSAAAQPAVAEAPAVSPAISIDPELLEDLALRLENLATRLETGRSSP